MKKKSKVLTALVMAGVLSGVCTSALAAESANYKDETLTYDGKDFLTLRIWEEGAKVKYPSDTTGITTVSRGLLQAGDKDISKNSLLKDEMASLKEGMRYIYNLIGSPKNGKVPVVHLLLNDEHDSNAEAGSSRKDDSKIVDFARYFVEGGKPEESRDTTAAASMTIDLPKSDRDYCLRNEVLPEVGLSDAHTGTVIHEMGHALGMSVAEDKSGGHITHNGYVYQNYSLSSTDVYTRALHDAFGKVSFTDEDEGKTTKIISYKDFESYNKLGSSPADTNKYFYLVDEDWSSGNYFMPVDEDGKPDEESNVYQVLDMENTIKIAWPDDAEMPAVAGIPINGWEYEKDEKATCPELSHIELQNSMMSHQSYRNWNIFMEAEIAILQDIGYSIDRSKFYGGSCYGSKFNAFSALKKPFTSAQDYAIGYHVYGSENAVLSGAEIKPTGYGAVGIRVDGVGNEITVNKEIELKGARSTGVMFSYGKGHTLNVTSPVKATGANSIGLRFDFGDNYNSNREEYRGSYIRGAYTAGNNGWYDMDALDALTGPLMEKVTVDADVTGTANAIYISKNAYVKEMVLGQSKDITITGNITSEWNPSDDLFTAEQAGNTDSNATDLGLNKAMLTEAKITDPAVQLLTDLKIKNNVVVDGNINGYDSLKVTVANEKTLTVKDEVKAYSLSGETGNLTFTSDMGQITVKDTLNLTGTLQTANPTSLDSTICIYLIGEMNNRNDHKIGKVKTGTLHVYTDDTETTKIAVSADVQKIIVEGLTTDYKKVTNPNKTVEETLTETADVVATNAPNTEIQVKLQEGYLTGNISGVVINLPGVESKKVVKSYTEKPNQANLLLSQMNMSALMGWRAQNNDMNKRLGELRMKNGEKGVWARMSRGENKDDATKRQFNLYQVGYDQEIGNKWILGGALSMTKGNANASSEAGYAKGEDKSGAFSLYASRLNDDGSFIDLVAKYGKTSYDVTSYMITGMGNYDYSTPSMSVSAEIGKRLKKGAYWMEPQAEFTFGMVKSASYTTSRRISAEQERFNSAVGRIGAVFGRDLPEGNIYVRASFLHDFAGNSDLNLIQNKISRSYTNDLGGSWWEFGIGTNLKTGKHSYIYADVEKTCGGKMQTPWRWNLGARWSF